MTVLADERARVERAKQKVVEARIFYQFFRRFPGDSSAGIEEIYRKALDQEQVDDGTPEKFWIGGDEVTLENLERLRPLLLQGVQSERYGHLKIVPASDSQVEQREQQEKETLLKQIRDRLKKRGTPTPVIEAEIRNRYSWMNLEELQAKLSEVENVAALRSKSPEELRQGIHDARERSSSGLPPLPEMYTAEKIRKLSADELRKVNRTYGHEAVNARLGVISRPQVGSTWSR
jgi:hypothetical protein